MPNELPFEWFVLVLRVLFIFVIYFFIFLVIRVVSRELRTAASSGADEPRLSGGLLVAEAGEARLRAGRVIPLDPVTVIGRDREATIVVESSFISGEHTQITWDHGTWWISDLRSTNGTFVNGHRIAVPTRLREGDNIGVGNTRFEFLR